MQKNRNRDSSVVTPLRTTWGKAKAADFYNSSLLLFNFFCIRKLYIPFCRDSTRANPPLETYRSFPLYKRTNAHLHRTSNRFHKYD